jgi:alpha-galactosidase
MIRPDTPDDTAWMYGVVGADRSAALMAYVQLDEPRTDQPAALPVPGLDPGRRCRLTDVTPSERPARTCPARRWSRSAWPSSCSAP